MSEKQTQPVFTPEQETRIREIALDARIERHKPITYRFSVYRCGPLPLDLLAELAKDKSIYRA